MVGLSTFFLKIVESGSGLIVYDFSSHLFNQQSSQNIIPFYGYGKKFIMFQKNT